MSTVAGNGTNGYAGDGGPAIDASLNSPQSVALDAIGNIYIADCDNNRIRKVDSNGIITTFVGNGTNEDYGYGGPATNATIKQPLGIRINAVGELYIVDFTSRRVRKVDTNGIISTVAGTGHLPRGGVSPFFGDGLPATNVEVGHTFFTMVDAVGRVFIADVNSHRIRKVNTNGIISTVAGNGKWPSWPYPTNTFVADGESATNLQLFQPGGMALDANGNLYFSDWEVNKIRMVDTNGFIRTIAGNGTEKFSGDGEAAISAGISAPADLAFDQEGNLIFSDSGNSRIRKIHFPVHEPLPSSK